MKNIQTASLQSAETVLRRMAITLAPELAKHKGLKPFGTEKRLCHMNTVLGVKTRVKMDDIIWLYGDSDNDIVWHSCLSSSADVCVVGAKYTKTGVDRWLGLDGFNTSVGILDLMVHMTVRQWTFLYFNDNPLSK